MTATVEIATDVGPARARVDGDGRDLAVLGHGAGGSVEAPDLLAVTRLLVTAGWRVARVEQPYRVSGRRAPAPARQLDLAWTSCVAALAPDPPGRLLAGGRSSGARVACRTAADVGADLVLCLAFPLVPPRRPVSRAGELALPGVPVLVVQGERDPFGRPADFPPGVEVAAVPGDHALRDGDAVAAAVSAWLARQRVA